MALFPTLFRFGLIADLQYADSPDGFSHVEKYPRRYRQSLQTLRLAAASFEINQTACNVLLGDQIDFKCEGLGMTQQCLQRVLDVTRSTAAEWHMCVGNHDLSALSREAVLATYVPPSAAPFNAAAPPSASRLYWAHCPCPGFRFLFLDPFDISALNASSPEHRALAEATLLRNPNLQGELKNGDWFVGLAPSEQRYVPFNGAVSPGQLDWIRRQLEAAAAADELVFVFCHTPIYHGAAAPAGLLWNAEELLALLQAHGCCKAVFSGHDHQGGYARDPSGLHHVVPCATLECDEGQPSFGTLHVSVSLPPPSPFACRLLLLFRRLLTAPSIPAARGLCGGMDWQGA